jgi:acyl carrier protein
MEKQQIALGILAKLSKVEPEGITPGMDLVGDLGIDSPKALSLLVELEDALGIEISDEDAARMDTVGDILDYVGKLSSG